MIENIKLIEEEEYVDSIVFTLSFVWGREESEKEEYRTRLHCTRSTSQYRPNEILLNGVWMHETEELIELSIQQEEEIKKRMIEHMESYPKYRLLLLLQAL
jgi:hypothetical protein